MNWVKTFFLLTVLSVLVVLAGGLIGGRGGLVIALGLAIMVNGGAYFFGDKAALAAAQAQEVTP